MNLDPTQEMIDDDEQNEVLEYELDDEDKDEEDLDEDDSEDEEYDDLEIVRIEPNTSLAMYGFLDDPQGGFLKIGYPTFLNSPMNLINTATNQLIDAAKLCNVPGGFLSKEFRNKRGTTIVDAGKFNNTELSSNELKNGIMINPMKEPSQTLLQLVQMMSQAAQELSNSADITESITGNTPAMTAYAFIDQQQQANGAIVREIYQSLGYEAKLLAELDQRYIDPTKYQEIVGDPSANFEDDFDLSSFSFMPVANPEISSKIQRLQQINVEVSQAALILQAGGDISPIMRSLFDATGSATDIDRVFPQKPPMVQVQELLAKHPDVKAQIMDERAHTEAITAQQLDTQHRDQNRQDMLTQAQAADLNASAASKKVKGYADLENVKSNKIKAQADMERAVADHKRADSTVHTTIQGVDGQALDNIKKVHEINQMEANLNNEKVPVPNGTS